MPRVTKTIQPLLQAALLFVARRFCKQLGLTHPTVSEILAATEASRSRAYELSSSITEVLPTLIRPMGRPPAQRQDKIGPSLAEDNITIAVLDYLQSHPGSAHLRGQRRVYSDAFRYFIVRLHTQCPHLTIEDFAERCRVPLGTLKFWFASANSLTDISNTRIDESGEPTPKNCTNASLENAHIETVLSEWNSWHGSFTAFIEHLRHDLRLPLGRQIISRILEAYLLRIPRRRKGRLPDEIALRGAFETFFPGAQWVGDGKSVKVNINGEDIKFNLELNVDADTGAWTGLSVRDEEDSQAVVDAFHNGVATTGAAPMALLLDNKPSNHTPEVDTELRDAGTLRIRATQERPQNKAHVEGAFGLFSQNVPPIQINTNRSNRCVARSILFLVALTFARAINHRPRADRNGLSRFALYTNANPTVEQIQQAQLALQERLRKQQLARQTSEARQRPHVRQLLDHHFGALGLADPERHLRLAIGRYPFGAIVVGIAIFTAKRMANTLPDGVDGRYLLGIVKNVAKKHECEILAQILWEQRLFAKDLYLSGLHHQRVLFCQPDRQVEAILKDFICSAIDTDRKLDRMFWLASAAEKILCQPAEMQKHLYDFTTRSISTAFKISPHERQDAIRFLSDQLVPLE